MKQKLLKLFKKLKSENGATGADIIVAMSIIVLTIGVISIIYINTSFGSKKVNRTAGATRIASNIIENINIENYDKIIAVNLDGATYAKNNSGSLGYVYNTKIPKGYNVDVAVDQINGDSSTYNICKKVTVTVGFSVRDKDYSVTLETSKVRENSSAVNEPDLTSITKNADEKCVPIKYSKTSGGYVITSANDPEWYDYENKNWAMVYVDTEANINSINGLVNVSGNKDKVYYWIPNFTTANSGQGICAYNSKCYLIEYKPVDETNNLYMYRRSDTEATSSLGSTDLGIWVTKTVVDGTSNSIVEAFKSTKFGPNQY